MIYRCLNDKSFRDELIDTIVYWGLSLALLLGFVNWIM
jgi:hypothetical protein